MCVKILFKVERITFKLENKNTFKRLLMLTHLIYKQWFYKGLKWFFWGFTQTALCGSFLYRFRLFSLKTECNL